MNAGGSNALSKSIVVGTATVAPTASFTFAPTSPASNELILFTDTSAGGPVSWSWEFGDGATSTTQRPTHTYETAKSYTVRLTVSNSSGTDAITHTVTVSPASPILKANFTFAPAFPAVGDVVKFTDASDGGPTSRLWEFGSGATSTLENPNCVFPAPGSYAVRLTVRNGSSSDTTQKTVLVVSPLDVPPTRVALNEVPRVADWPTFAPGAIIITDGWNASADGWLSELTGDMCNSLKGVFVFAYPDAITRVCQGSGWDVWVVDWQSKAGLLTNGSPLAAYHASPTIGDAAAAAIAKKAYKRIHFIAHSAGANLIEQASGDLAALSGGQITIHETFLDAYDFYLNATRYGAAATWADNYVDTRDVLFGVLDGTRLVLQHAFNVDVTPPANFDGCLSALFNSDVWKCRHSRPYRFYGRTMSPSFVGDAGDMSVDPISPKTFGLGSPLSIEQQRSVSDLSRQYPAGSECYMTDAACTPITTGARSGAALLATFTSVNVTVNGKADYTTGDARTLFTALNMGSASTVTALPRTTISAATDAPSVITVDFVTTSAATNLAYGWNWTTGGEGDLRIFVDGVLVREMDERFLAPASNGENVLIGLNAVGRHQIVLRLDGFGSSTSGIRLTNVQLTYESAAPSRHRAIAHTGAP
jgi:PKD repeat protein